MRELWVGTWNLEYARGVEKNQHRPGLIASQAAQVWVLTETHDDLDLSATHRAIHSDQRYARRPIRGAVSRLDWTLVMPAT